MALAVVLPEVGIPLVAATAATRSAIGEEDYGKGRSAITWGYGAINGFSPIPPMITLLPIKIGLFVVILLICIFVLNMGPKAILAAYLGQAIIIMFMSERIMSTAIKLTIAG